MEDVELEVQPEALKAIAQHAIKRRTGARGLRSIVEQALLDTMYELPSLKNVAQVILDENAITGNGEPVLVYDQNRQGDEGTKTETSKLRGAA